VMFATSGGVTPYVRSGRLRALAISTPQPSPLAPGLPTIAAAGNLPGYESAATAGVFAPAGTSEAVVNRVSEEVRKVLAKPEAKERFLRQGVEAMGLSPGETAAYIKADTASVARIIREGGIRGER